MSSDLVKRMLASRWTWWALIVAYVGLLAVLLAPVVLSGVGADDGYWILVKDEDANGSLWNAIWKPLTVAFDFDFQPRTTALAFSERAALAILTMRAAVFFSIPPFLVWGIIKLALFALSIVAVAIFLRHVRFRDRRGVVRGLERSTIAFITIALPLTIALGVKSQNVRSLNGWNFYPTLSYGPFICFLLFGALVLRASRLLQRDYRRWAVPAALLMIVMGVAINLSYEVIALTIPLSVLLLVLDPRPTEGSLWMRWRAPFTIGASLAITYAGLFVWIRVQISQMACQAANTCYSGTVIDVNPRTLWNNFLGSLPGGTSEFVRDRADRQELPYPGVTSTSVMLGLAGAVLLVAMWGAWREQHRDEPRPEEVTSAETRGLLLVVLVASSIALGATVITGINANAVAQLETPMLSYRANVVTWSALSLAGLALTRLLVLMKKPVIGVAAVACLLLLVIGSTALNQPRNAFTAQTQRVSTQSTFTDTIHREVALGSRSRESDRRRCQLIADHLDRIGTVDPRTQRTISGAYTAFELYHHTTFCSTGIGDQPPSP